MAKKILSAVTSVLSKKNKGLLGGLIMLLAMVFSALPVNAQNRNLKTNESQQLLSLGGGLEWRGGELGYSSSLSYLNFEENSHLLWGGEFKMAFNGGFPLPSAYIVGGAHLRFGNVRLYAAPRIGVGAMRVYMRAHNEFFERETSQRQFTFTLGGEVGVQIQGRVFGFGVVAGYDGNLFRQLNPSTDMTIDEFNKFKNPLSVRVQLSYNLQSGVMRRCGDYPWLVEAGYIVALGESTPRAYVKIGQSIRQSARWNGEWGLQLEENYSKSYSAACLTFEESFFLHGSNTWVRPLLGAKVGFGNVPVEVNAHALSEQEGGTGEIWSHTKNMQPGFMVGAYAGFNVRLFSAFEAKIALDLNRAWSASSVANGYDESSVNYTPKTDLGLRLGLIYSF